MRILKILARSFNVDLCEIDADVVLFNQRRTLMHHNNLVSFDEYGVAEVRDHALLTITSGASGPDDYRVPTAQLNGYCPGAPGSDADIYVNVACRQVGPLLAPSAGVNP